RAWKSATRAKALDLLRGLLPAGALTNLGLFGNGRAFEYLITKMAAHELPECRRLATNLHHELSLVIPAFVRRALDDKYGMPAAYRDLHRHRMLTQDRQLLGTGLGYDVPPGLGELGMDSRFVSAVEAAAAVHGRLEKEVGPALAQYVVPLAFHVRWYFRANLREIYHLCELRTTPQGHADYRWVAQEMFRRVAEVHPRLAAYARFVDL